MRYIDKSKYISKATILGYVEEGSDRSRMLYEAIKAAGHAYCPYSQFNVGAALITTEGRIYMGCNVENVMYNGMSHAEQTAITTAIVQQGSDMQIAEMVIWTPTPEPVPSCGGCRQLIREHAVDPNVMVWSFSNDPETPPMGCTVEQLLPHSFGPEML